ncbi:MAG: helix-turn-helix transcriptional regulator [Planctomycetes bacterium]|nr:helix-turn-helix transcriptional regulator [Planctomycetota bacterium]
MGKIPNALRETIAANIRACRIKKFPGRGGGKKCAEAFGVSPQQWSPWERGMRTPDELRLQQIANFFKVTVEYLRRDHSKPVEPEPHPEAIQEEARIRYPGSAGSSQCPFFRPPMPGQPDGSGHCSCWLAERLYTEIRDYGVKIHPDDMRQLLGHRFPAYR